MAAAQQEEEDSYLLPDNTDDVLAFLDNIGTSAANLQKKPKGQKPKPKPRQDYSDSYSSSYDDRRQPQKITGNVIPGVTSPRVRMVEEFMKQTEASGDFFQKWYSENYEKVQNYEYVRFQLLSFLEDYMPGINVDENIAPLNLVELVKELFLDLQTKFNKFNLQLNEISGHEVAGYIQSHRRKVLEVVEDYEKKLKDATEEAATLREHVAHLDAELTATRQRLMYIERGTAYYGGFEDSLSEGQFMADLQSRVAHSQSLSSSMREELEREKQENVGLKRELAQFNRDKVETEEKCMREIVELSKRAEINSMVQHGIEAVLKEGSKEPNPEDCQNIIDNWKKEINQVIDHNSKEISELLKRVEEQNKEMATLEAQALEMDERIEQMKTQVQNKKSLHEKYREEASNLQAHVDDFKKVIEELHHESFGLRSLLGRNKEGPGSSEDDLDFTNEFVGPIDGEIAEYDLLNDTQPIRWGARRRRRRRLIPSLSSTGSYEEDSTPEQPELPMEGLGMIRITGEDEWEAVGPPESPPEPIRSPQGNMRFVDGQWVTSEGPLIASPVQSPRDPRLMGVMRLDEMGRGRIGEIGHTAQAQTGVDMRLIDGQWVPQRTRSPPPRQSPIRSPGPIPPVQTPRDPRLMGVMRLDEMDLGRVGESGPTEQAQAGVDMRLIDGQWVPQRARSPSPLQSPTRSPGPIPPVRTPRDPRLMGVMRLDEMGRGTVDESGFAEQSQAGVDMRLIDGQWVPRRTRSPPPRQSATRSPGPVQAGADMRLVNGQWVPQRRRSPPPLHSTTRSPGRTAIPVRGRPHLDVSSIRSISPGATPPRRLQAAGTRPVTQRPRPSPRQGAAGMPLSVPRPGTASRLGTSSVRPPAARARGTPRADASAMRSVATRPGTPPRPGGSAQRPRVSQRSAIPGVRQAAPRARTSQRPGTSYRQAAGVSTQTDPLSARVMLLSPHRQQPLPLEVDLAAQNIIPGQDEFLCEVAVGVHPAATPPTPSVQDSGRGRRSRRARPQFTPRTGFQR